MRRLSSGGFASIVGQDELVVHRLLCLALAFLVFFMFKNASRAVSPTRQLLFSKLSKSDRISLSCHPALVLTVALLLTRWGGLEQLFVLVGIASLNMAPGVDAKLDSEQRRAFLYLSIFAIALALANSRTWTYSLLPTALAWSCLQKSKMANLRRIVLASSMAVLIFILLFLSNASFETLVSHLTQRWLYVNEPRYAALPWSGPDLVLKIISFTLLLVASRCTVHLIPVARQHSPEQDNKKLFAALLVIFSGLHLLLYQKNILMADVALLGTLTFISAQGNQSGQETIAARRPQATKSIDALLKIGFLVIGFSCLAGVTLILSPATSVVKDLAATFAGVLMVCKKHVLLTSLTLLAAAAALLVGVFKSPASDLMPKRQNAMLLALLAMIGATELRSFFLWEQLGWALDRIPERSQLLYLPKLEPMVRLMPRVTDKNKLVVLFEGASFMENEPQSMLLVPSSASELCRAANWNIDSEYGIFTLCDAGQGTLLHLLPLN